MSRVYLDWNATAPLRPEARDAMIAAMDVVGNPSSVHGEGRKAHILIETAREQIAELAGVDRNEVIFTSGATEGAALATQGRSVACADFEHDAVLAHRNEVLGARKDGELDFDTLESDVLALQSSNSETGMLQNNFHWAQRAWKTGAMVLVDGSQSAGRFGTTVSDLGADFLMLSAHKLGGPKGVGALCLKLGVEVKDVFGGGGQEQGRRSGTENVIGIVGFGAAAAAAERDRKAGLWDGVYALRNQLEEKIANVAYDAIFVSKDSPRLPNTSCIAVPGWKGETQVMQMDLAGYAISAGSACSSGKVKRSRVLTAMGFDDITASSAIRVSIGPTTTQNELMGFADAWLAQYKKFKARAA
ncbi:aminotransferase class V-fold PLP-dependent enzyme [Amylibacter sp.]|nr:aminotransferase class V-fold PLP-dependent enzyme [Amylibacter sp.]